MDENYSKISNMLCSVLNDLLEIENDKQDTTIHERLLVKSMRSRLLRINSICVYNGRDKEDE